MRGTWLGQPVVVVLAALVGMGAGASIRVQHTVAASTEEDEPRLVQVRTRSCQPAPWTTFRALVNARGHIEHFETVSLGRKHKVLVMPNSRQCSIPRNTGRPELLGEDLNFDGYPDLGVLCAAGATGYLDYSVWLWDPEKQKLRYSPDFSRILEHIKLVSVSCAHRTLTTTAGDLRSRSQKRYSVVDGRPVLSYARSGKVNKEGIWEISILQRQEGRLVLIDRTKTKGASPW